MRPNKVHGLTQYQRARRCTGKQRWSDELAAQAGALLSLETHGGVDQLWTYRCPHCQGWHLTKSRQSGKKPITLETT